MKMEIERNGEKLIDLKVMNMFFRHKDICSRWDCERILLLYGKMWGDKALFHPPAPTFPYTPGRVLYGLVYQVIILL